MARLRVHPERILLNVRKLSAFLSEHNVQWTLVAKVLSGDNEVLQHLLESDAFDDVHSIADARISGLQSMKEVRPDIRTMYLKPPAIEVKNDVVECADVSVNSSSTTVLAIIKASERRGIVHKIIVMLEMGELREGIIRDNILLSYE